MKTLNVVLYLIRWPIMLALALFALIYAVLGAILTANAEPLIVWWEFTGEVLFFKKSEGW